MSEQPDLTWEHKTLEKLLLNTFKEQRRSRRWGIFFKLLFFTYLFAILWLVWPNNDGVVPTSKEKPHVALIAIHGEISEGGASSADNIIESLQDAVKDKNTKAVVLDINSPGGSPVQASDIYNEIRYQQSKHPNIKIYAVCSDLCASAAYYIASATNDIYANPASLVGSIGVLVDGFGFVDAMQKLGIQRRLYTSGAHKGFLDPFSPESPADMKFAQTMLDSVHNIFINDVKQGRGKRLKDDNPDLFSGLVWSGEQALPLGLIDGFGDVNYVTRNVVKTDVIVDYTNKPNYFDQLAKYMGSSFAHEIATQFASVAQGLK